MMHEFLQDEQRPKLRVVIAARSDSPRTCFAFVSGTGTRSPPSSAPLVTGPWVNLPYGGAYP